LETHIILSSGLSLPGVQNIHIREKKKASYLQITGEHVCLSSRKVLSYFTWFWRVSREICFCKLI